MFLYNVDDLQGLVNDNLRSRKGEAAKADALVDEEVAAFCHWLRSRAIGPMMGQLQAHGREVAEAEVARMLPKLGELSPAQRQAVEQLGRQIVQKLLHRPMATLRKASAEGVGGFDGVTLAEALEVLCELQAAAGGDAAPVVGAGAGTVSGEADELARAAADARRSA